MNRSNVGGVVISTDGRAGELWATAGGTAGRVFDEAWAGRLAPDLLPTRYPRLEDWQAVRDEMDPDGVFRSDRSRRWGLVRSAHPGHQTFEQRSA